MRKAVNLIIIVIVFVLCLSAIDFEKFFLINMVLLTVGFFKAIDLYESEEICYNKNNRGN